MTNEQLVQAILKEVGGQSNVLTASNCMTRLRLQLKDGSKVNEEALKNLEDVMGIVHDREDAVEVVVGPGKSRKCADYCQSLGIPAAANDNDWQANKAAIKAGQKDNKIKSLLKTFGDILSP